MQSKLYIYKGNKGEYFLHSKKDIVILTMLWLSQFQHNLTLSFTSPTLCFTSPTLSFYLALEAECMYAIHSMSAV